MLMEANSKNSFYLPKMATNEWTGTMNLTESHCGTDLGLMRTKAEPQADGSYKNHGTKKYLYHRVTMICLKILSI